MKWSRALTLRERVHVLRRSARIHPGLDRSLGEQRLLRWRQLFKSEDFFSHRLEQDGFTEEDLVNALSLPDSELESWTVLNSPWLKDFAVALNWQNDPTVKPLLVPTYGGFEKLVAPLIGCFATKILSTARGLFKDGSGRWNEDLVSSSLVHGMMPALIKMIQKALVLEVNVARLQGELRELSPEARLQEYLRGLDNYDQRVRFFGQYPVLAREVTHYLDQFSNFTEGLLKNLTTDWEEIEDVCGTKLGRLQGIERGQGDSHRGGKQVLILRFDSNLAIVYKPRSLKVDLTFQEFVRWLNANELQPPLPTVWVLDKVCYGWTQYVARTACNTQTEVERFYERQGSWLAVLHSLGATDLHYENIIASGEYPFLVDIEALFHPSPKQVINSADDLAKTILTESVAAVGMLPSPSFSNQIRFDISGLGAEALQDTPFEGPGLIDHDRDTIRVGRVAYKTGETKNLPTLHNQVQPLGLYKSNFVHGFSKCYRLMLGLKDQVLEKIDNFANAETRLIMRPTVAYSNLIQESWHPNLLRDSVKREIFFDHLLNQISSQPNLLAFTKSERSQILGGDIPYFSCTPASDTATGGDGEIISISFCKIGLEVASERIAGLSEAQHAVHLEFIQRSFASMSTRAMIAPAATLSDAKIGSDFESSSLTLAREVADKLLRDSISKESTLTWLTLTYQSGGTSDLDGCYRSSLVGSDLYEGLSGIIFFLAYLAKYSGESYYFDQAKLALNTIDERLDANPKSLNSSGFSGWPGLIYLYSHLAGISGEEVYLKKAIDSLRYIELPEDKDNQKNIDVISGLAGTILSLLSLYKISANSEVLSLACGLGRKLAQSDTKSLPIQRGFSHGISGISYALSELAFMSGDETFRTTALNLLDRETILIGRSKWTDMHMTGDQPQATWCHGAPGIALSRLKIYRRYPSPEIKLKAEEALLVSMKAKVLDNHTLCHGALGNCDPFIVAAELCPNDPRWSAHLKKMKGSLISEVKQTGWMTAMPERIETPGLMTGLAGIGYGFLRLANSTLPSVLALDPPRPL